MGSSLLAEFVFEEMGFQKYCAVPPPLLAYVDHKVPYRGTSLTRKHRPLGPYSRPIPRVLGGS